VHTYGRDPCDDRDIDGMTFERQPRLRWCPCVLAATS
jgi:hypothetical protein